MPCCAAASIFCVMPPTGPMIPPELMVPVIAMLLRRGMLVRWAVVSIAAAAPALGPPTSPGNECIV